MELTKQLSKTLVCKFDEIKDQEIRSIFVKDKEFLIIKNGDKIYSFENLCPHQFSKSLKRGFVEDNRIYCPNHMFGFELETGRHPASKQKLYKAEIEIIDDMIYIVY